MIAVSQSAATGEDVLLVKRRGLGPVEPLIVTKAGEKNGTPSPDGKSFVYSSDKNGRRELFLRPYGAASPEVTVSPQGGDEPVWSHDGRELFYRGTTERGGRLMAVRVELSTPSKSSWSVFWVCPYVPSRCG